MTTLSCPSGSVVKQRGVTAAIPVDNDVVGRLPCCAGVTAYRLNRLFDARSRRCLDVAVDHGFVGEPAFLCGIEDMRAAVERLVEAGPDAIQLTAGQAELLQSRPGRDKPALVLRTDVANVYGSDLPGLLYSRMIEDPVGQAVRLDAACVVVNLLEVPGHPEVRRDCIENVLRLKPQCERAGMPMMVEPLVLRPAGGADGDVERILGVVRQAVELGADVIKADPSDDLLQYHRVVEAARVPVLVRGGGRVADDLLLERTRAVLEQGAAGIVYGRNIIQHSSPRGITRALMAMVHEDVGVERALAMLDAEAVR
jgi:fructose-bisphosphate aldolase, class I